VLPIIPARLAARALRVLLGCAAREWGAAWRFPARRAASNCWRNRSFSAEAVQSPAICDGLILLGFIYGNTTAPIEVDSRHTNDIITIFCFHNAKESCYDASDAYRPNSHNPYCRARQA
jgi:hypothetical protein